MKRLKPQKNPLRRQHEEIKTTEKSAAARSRRGRRHLSRSVWLRRRQRQHGWGRSSAASRSRPRPDADARRELAEPVFAGKDGQRRRHGGAGVDGRRKPRHRYGLTAQWRGCERSTQAIRKRQRPPGVADRAQAGREHRRSERRRHGRPALQPHAHGVPHPGAGTLCPAGRNVLLPVPSVHDLSGRADPVSGAHRHAGLCGGYARGLGVSRQNQIRHRRLAEIRSGQSPRPR